MFRLTKTDEIDIEKYLNHLRYLGYIYVNPSVLESGIQKWDINIGTHRGLIFDVVGSKSGGTIIYPTKEQLGSFLVKYENVPPSLIYKKNSSGGQSLSLAEKVTSKLLDLGYAVEFVTLYQALQSNIHTRGIVNSMLKGINFTDKLNNQGEPLGTLGFTINERDNRRTYYKKFGIQSMPKVMCNSIQAPNGYVLVSGDLSQSDPRIIYSLMLRTPDNIDTFMQDKDKYKSLSRLFMNNEFDEAYFDEHRKELKDDILKPFYGGKSGVNEYSTRLITLENEFLTKSKKYQQNLERIKTKIDKGLPLNITSYFGYIQPINTGFIDVSNNSTNTAKLKADALNKALNTPIQTGTAEVIAAVANSIMDRFKALGYDESNESIYCYLNRHDELIFLIKEELLKYAYIFQEHEVIQVDDWVPMELDFSYTDTYTQKNEYLDTLAKSYYKPDITKDNLTYSPGPSVGTFIPTKDYQEIYVLSKSINVEGSDYTTVLYYDSRNKKMTCDYLEGVYTASDLHDIIIYNIDSAHEEIESNDCDCVLMYSEFVNSDATSYSNILIKECPYEANQNKPFLEAKVLLQYCLLSLLYRNDVDKLKTSELVKSNGNFIKNVLHRGELIKLATAQ